MGIMGIADRLIWVRVVLGLRGRVSVRAETIEKPLIRGWSIG
jgi:hypothetical protein